MLVATAWATAFRFRCTAISNHSIVTYLTAFPSQKYEDRFAYGKRSRT